MPSNGWNSNFQQEYKKAWHLWCQPDISPLVQI